MQQHPPQRELAIYIGRHCSNCEEALRIAEHARTIEGLNVVVIDLDQPGQQVPSQVFAVPTYLFDGKVVSLGNPEREEFLAQLRQAVKEKA